VPAFTIFTIKSTLAPLKFNSIIENSSEKTKGVEINKVIKDSKIIFELNKNWYFEIKIKKIIEKITGNEDGLDANNKIITKKSCK
tara:strand:+ start:318 stop:572 length:255 start_codon:yes stop_codon:yes gene_type:complete